jgi:O-antigen ligase
LVPPDRWHALGLYRAYFIEPIALFYVAVDLLGRERDVRILLWGLAIGSSAFAVLNIGASIVNYAHGHYVMGSPPTALYTSSPEVAMYLEPPFAIALGFVMLAKERRDRWFALGWATVLAVALALTLSRGAYLAIAILAGIIIIGSRRRLLLTGGLVAVVVGLLQIPLVTHRFAGQFDLTNPRTTVRGRLSIFTDTLTTDVSQHPLFGVGLGGYHYVFRGQFPEIYPHDIWLTFWVEVGLLGMVAFGIVFFGLIYRGWKAYRTSKGFARSLLWGTLGALVLWGVHGLVDSPYWKNDMSIEFWMVAAMEVVAIRRLHSPPAMEATP